MVFIAGLTGDWVIKNGIHTRNEALADQRAADTWNTLVEQHGEVFTAAATDKNNPFGKYPEWIFTHIEEGSSILDAGCGYGRIAIPILEKHSKTKIIGVDASQNMLNRFHVELEKRSLSERCRLVNDNLYPLPLDDSSVDCVVTCAVLLHNPYRDVRKILDEFFRVLKPGGKIIVISAFVNALTLDGIQNRLYVALKSESNGPVHPYTKWGCLSALVKFEDVQLFAHQLILLPRRFLKFNLPFQGLIRRCNIATRNWNLTWWLRLGLFVQHFDVVARKAKEDD